mmetsp:Transcript_65356/g.184486  ORF Transcript_65356/g.184486 Transcript_65356/m.184486 type:complete len:203 (+) Transcript_65356:218-826(+)
MLERSLLPLAIALSMSTRSLSWKTWELNSESSWLKSSVARALVIDGAAGSDALGSGLRSASGSRNDTQASKAGEICPEPPLLRPASDVGSRVAEVEIRRASNLARKRAQAAGFMPSFALVSSSSRATSQRLAYFETSLSIANTPCREPERPYLGKSSRCSSKAASARPSRWKPSSSGPALEAKCKVCMRPWNSLVLNASNWS